MDYYFISILCPSILNDEISWPDALSVEVCVGHLIHLLHKH